MTKKIVLTLNEVCHELDKSKRTITRYVKKGLLNPEKVKSGNKTPEYRFSQSEVENLKNQNTRGQNTRQNQKSDTKEDDTLSLLKDNMKLLEKQLKAKDRQIKQMLDRQRETNYLIGQLQNKVLLLEDKTKGKNNKTKDRTEDKTNDTLWRVKKYFNRLLGRKLIK